MIASCNGKCNPIPHFSADESLRATNNFNPLCTIRKSKLLPWSHTIKVDDPIDDAHYTMYMGSLDDRPIIVKEFEGTIMEDEFRSFAIYDIVITTQMSNHMNAADCLELANAITYLHTALSRPVIHRDIRHGSFFLDHYLVPKFCNFSLSKKIPPNLLHADDDVKGIYGYLDPNYVISGSVTEKSDVYCFGVLLLVFLAGKMRDNAGWGTKFCSIIENGKAHIQNDRLRKEIVLACKIYTLEEEASNGGRKGEVEKKN
ncbi:serine/threonine-protein kinase ZRK1-like [Castanea sativa]|uniref:serine/threonine-protein kinase ZRK1-like n=1 Tax=Castanea sativa TaxID=21020 RepID=UPI003F64B68A